MRSLRISNIAIIFALLFLVGTLLVLTTSLASARRVIPPANQQVIARVKNVQIDNKNIDTVSKDQASVIRASNRVVEAAQKGVALYANDEFNTGTNVRVAVAVEGGSANGLIFISQNSRVQIRQDSATIYAGDVLSQVKGLFNLETKYYTMGPRGTEFEVEVGKDGVARVIVLEGAVEVERRNAVVQAANAEGTLAFGVSDRNFFNWGPRLKSSIELPETLMVYRLQEAVLPISKPPGQAQATTEQQVRRTLEWTNQLIISSEPADPVGNVVPAFLNAEERNATFKSARYDAIWKQEIGSHETLGSIYNEWGEGVQAFEEFQRELTINPSRIESQTFLTRLAEALRLMGELNQASEQARKALAVDNCWAPAKNSVGNIGVDRAAIAFRQGDNQTYRGLLESAVKEYQEAFDGFSKRENLEHPLTKLILAVTKLNQAKAYFALGDIAEEQGKHAEAARYFDAGNAAFDKAKELKPDYLAKAAGNLVAQKCDRVESIEDCHARFPTGCSLSGTYDAFLNFLKTGTQVNPNSRPLSDLAQADFRGLEASIPTGLAKSNHADHADALVDLGEGRVYSMTGYLLSVKPEGPETANCQLRGADSSDYQLQISFRPIGTGDRASDPVASRQLGQQSIVAKVTPFFRARYHPSWTLSSLRQLLGRQVLVVGQLLLDNNKLTPNDDCGNPQANLERCWRASAWELHPVTQLYVCEGNSPCNKNLPNWKRID